MSEERDLEKELKEEKDRYERQNQEAYDEVTKGNEELRRRQEEEKKKGLLDEGSGFRTTLAIGTEVGLNTLLDLFSFVPPAQVAGGSAINYLAQRIRGGEFSEGEFIASGLASLIPGAAQAKSLGGVIGKTATRGAVSGALETGAADLIDTGKIDAGNVLAGAGVGGAFGGIFGTAIGMNPTKVGNTIAKIKARARGGDFIPLDTNDIVQGVGSVGAAKRSNINQSSIDSEIDMKPFTLKFKPQQWEQYSKQFPNLFESSTGRPAKPDAPLEIGEITTLVPDVQRGKPIRTFQKSDIDLREFKIKKTPINKVVERFRRRISALMQADRIRSTDAGTKDGFTKTSRNINNFTEGTNEISSMYYDYLVGYFNRFIRSGKVDNFEKAVNVIAPKVKGGEIVEGLQTLKGDVGLIRELRLFTIDPNVYKSDAFKIKGESYQAKLKSLIRQYNAAGAQELKEKTGRFAGKYRFDGHHIDQVAEGWPLYRGLPKEEIPLMREMIRSYGLNPGNHPENVLILLNKLHKEYHAIHWPAALKRLKNSSTGWDIDELQKIKTAEGRRKWVENYVQETLRSRDEVIQKASNLLDSYAAVQETTLNELTEAQIDRLSKDVVDPLLAKPTPKGIKQEIDKDFPLDED